MTFRTPDEVVRRLEPAVLRRGVTVDQVVVEAFTWWTEHHTGEQPELSFIGIGQGRPDLAEHHDDILEAFIGCAASGTREPYDIHRARVAAADARLGCDP